MNDAELERRLRDANPARTPLERLTSREFALMERIMADAPTRSASRWRMPNWRVAVTLVTAAAAAVAAAVVAVGYVVSPAPATAFGPPPIDYSNADTTLSQVIEESSSLLDHSSGVEQAERESSSVDWSITLTDEGEPEQLTYVLPYTRELAWNEDLSGTFAVRAGQPYPAWPGALGEVPEAVQPGDLIDEVTYRAGEYPVSLANADDLDDSAIVTLLDDYVSPDSENAGDTFWAASDLLNEWTLTNDQHKALIAALTNRAGIAVLGEGQDWEDRPVWAIQASTSGGTVVTLLISRESGHIVGFQTSVGSGSEMPWPTGTITSYTLWKD